VYETQSEKTGREGFKNRFENDFAKNLKERKLVVYETQSEKTYLDDFKNQF
jgi:hypothetical protein